MGVLWATKTTGLRRTRLFYVKAAQVQHLSALGGSLGMIALLHVSSPPALESWRVPTYLIANAPVFGWTPREAINSYHLMLGILAAVAICNFLGLRWHQMTQWRALGRTSTLVGLVALSALASFFGFGLIQSVRLGLGDPVIDTSVIYTVYGLALLVIDVQTFLLLRGQRLSEHLRTTHLRETIEAARRRP